MSIVGQVSIGGVLLVLELFLVGQIVSRDSMLEFLGDRLSNYLLLFLFDVSSCGLKNNSDFLLGRNFQVLDSRSFLLETLALFFERINKFLLVLN